MNPTEACLVALTELITSNQNRGGWRNGIEREIQYLTPFDGQPGTLPAFIGAVTRILQDHPEEQNQVFSVIFNNKIRGAARNIIGVIPPNNWTDSKQHLLQHFKPQKNQLQITKEINQLNVRSIEEIENKIKMLVEDITEYATFEDGGGTMWESFFQA